MVERSTQTATRCHSGRLVIALALGTLVLSACATQGPQSPRAIHADTDVQSRFGNPEKSSGYTTVVPRAPVPLDLIADDAPEQYTVIKGDTLWDISDRFLKQPWLWPTIWDYNPQIANPHLIYPGDKIALQYIDGKPTLVLSRNGQRVPLNGDRTGAGGSGVANGTSRLSPQIRTESLNKAIPTIPGEAIRQFLVHPRVVAESEISDAPYVVAHHDNRLISAVGHKIYARGLSSRDHTQYGVFRRSKTLRDPMTREVLGFEVTHVADAQLQNLGDPSTLAITRNRMETIAGDILLPAGSEQATFNYVPRLPAIQGDGRIVSLVNAIAKTGRDQVVVLNLGERSGTQVGDVLAIETRGGSIVDTRGRRSFERVELPNYRTGVVMVFQTFDKVSYALVMESTRPIMANDIVTGL